MLNQTTDRAVRGVVSGTANFSTTDATGDLDCGGLLVVESVQLTPMAAPATDEHLYVSEAMADYKITVPADGKIAIGRTGASKTSALPFSYTLRGY
jgi:hypothetical protein